MKKITSLLVMLAMVLAFGASEALAVVDIEGRYWITSMDDDVRSGAAGTTINLVNDLGVDDKENFFDVRAILELGSHKIRYGYMPMSWEGAKTITGSYTFNGQTYSASDNVSTKLDVGYHRLGYEYDLLDTLNNKIGVIFELKYFDIDASLTATGKNEQASIKAPIPTVGVALQAGLPFLFSVGGEITGMTLGSTAWLVDAEAGVNFKPAPFVVVSGGYRLLRMHADLSDDLVDISVDGPFLMLRADF